MSHSTQHTRFAPPEAATEVSENIFAYVQPDGSWWINNTGFVVGNKGVITVDACATEARTRSFIAAISKVTKAPIRTLVNTHHHGDHTFGNYLFDGATIVGREGIREAVLAWGTPDGTPSYWDDVDFGDIELSPPFLTFTEEIKLFSDNLECRVTYVGAPAHTTNDSVVWIPERRVLFAGDLLFAGGTPFLLQGSITGALEALEAMRALDAETIVPGHGPVCGSEVIDSVASYLHFVQRTARAGMAAGLTPLEVARDTDLGEYAGLLDSERIVGNLHRAFADLYAQMSDTRLGAPIDDAAALRDMVAFNGGRPLSCYA